MAAPPPLKKAAGNVPRLRLSHPRIMITQVKSIKPPDVRTTKEKEEEELRAQLHKEIELRSRVCEHRLYECTQPVLTGRQYCARHILDDPSAPYKQCAHTGAKGERCPLPAPAPQPHDNRKDQGLCFEHARAALHSRQRSAAPPPAVITTESLLAQLQHYVRPERARTTSCASSVSVVSDPSDQDQPGIPHAVDPFKQIDAVSVNASVSSSVMEAASEEDSDADSVTIGCGGTCRAGAVYDDSDADDTPYDRYPLRYAGIFTAEEAVSEARSALVMLKDAYGGQMGRLRKVLGSARCRYVKDVRVEKEQHCSINAQARSGPLTVHERRQLRKLKAYASYHRRHGVDSVLARKLHRKRAKVNEPHPPRVIHNRCTFSDDGVRCDAHTLPAAKYCARHVLEDNSQVLFVSCGDARGLAPCREPVPLLPLPAHSCRYHTDPPLYTVFTLKKDESECDSDSQTGNSELSHLEEGVDVSVEDKSDLATDYVYQ